MGGLEIKTSLSKKNPPDRSGGFLIPYDLIQVVAAR